MKTAEEKDDRHGREGGTSLEKYLLMDEKEKDVEVQKAVVRLQKRIQEILYLLETDHPQMTGSESKKNKA